MLVQKQLFHQRKRRDWRDENKVMVIRRLIQPESFGINKLSLNQRPLGRY